MQNRRPDPDELLRGIESDARRQQQGKLKLFLGASAGVGKTFAMLSEAREQLDRGVDVVIGTVETHGRKETQALIEGLEQLPPKEIEYKGVTLTEFDLDGAITRRPELILVDELAHTNAPGSKHPKRWQDIDELLRAGISVYTAVNIQHLESLNDAVAQITRIQVKETVPDSFLDRVDHIEVVDIPPEELQQRLREGKVYVPDRIEHALEGFFRMGNLIALRELALRRAADRVDAEMQSYRAEQGVRGLWPARERVLVCIAPNLLAAKVVRSAARLGAASHAEMHAVYVESERQANRPQDQQEHAHDALKLAESLGMHTLVLSGHDIVGEILKYARSRNINLIVVGKPIRARWKELITGSVVDELVRRSGDIDVHVITMEEDGKRAAKTQARRPPQSLVGVLAAVAVPAFATGVCLALYAADVELTNLVMVYLAGVAIVASRYDLRAAVLASVLSVAAFDFIFVHPRGTFAVSDAQYIVTFGVMLAVALLISTLATRLRRYANSSAERERRTAALYTMSKELARSRNKRELAKAAAMEIRDVFGADTAVYLGGHALQIIAGSASGFEKDSNEEAVAAWVLTHNEPAGKGTDTLPGARGLYLPLRGAAEAVGVLAILPDASNWPLPPAQRNLLETFANGLGLAIERAVLAKESQEARLEAESERIRNALLSSISHDLRSPLTAIAGAASSLKEGQGNSAKLADTIYHESVRLNLQVQNLLDMTRLQSGDVQANLEWHSLEEIVGSALSRTSELLQDRQVIVQLPPDVPLVLVDGSLFEKVITNLLENVASHTPTGSPLQIGARNMTEIVSLDISDSGPGIPKGSEARIFERFFRREDRREGEGFGLGLAICRAIMKLHGGRIWAENRRDALGAVFHVEIKKTGSPPEVPVG